jgi:hypothetical protein
MMMIQIFISRTDPLPVVHISFSTFALPIHGIFMIFLLVLLGWTDYKTFFFLNECPDFRPHPNPRSFLFTSEGKGKHIYSVHKYR